MYPKNVFLQIKNAKKIIGFFIIIMIFISGGSILSAGNIPDSSLISQQQFTVNDSDSSKTLIRTYLFSDPEIHYQGNTFALRIPEAEFTMGNPDKPVIPYHYETITLPFGSKILDVAYDYTQIQTMNITGIIAHGGVPGIDSLQKYHSQKNLKNDASGDIGLYPYDWISYHTGGGLNYGEHVTFFVLRTYPARYDQTNQQIQFTNQITVNITYQPPDEPFFSNHSDYDLLIITPDHFLSDLNRLVEHKQRYGVQTRCVSLSDVYDKMFWYGRDNAEKIKYFIKNAIESWGITSVLLIGGIQGQTDQWTVPVRYSYVVPPEEQEYAEQRYLSDLYFADIYDGAGNFSSWDSNHDNRFSVWNETFHETMDLYPDVYLGRLPCRHKKELNIMIDKIIDYEETKADSSWFSNLILVAGDSYDDVNGYNEGELIAEAALTVMPDAIPVKIYASQMDINRKTVNAAMNQGAGFAYFCGHGSPISWSTHFPPDGTEWTTGYNLKDMIPLRNKQKLPITVVGGCHNGQFDVTLMNIIKGIRADGFRYFSTNPNSFGDFWYNEWVPNCWAWMLTSLPNGGAIATIANTGLGTHGDGDLNLNDVADYLEVLDGWLELRFLELYGKEHKDNLGLNHGQTMTEYLQRFMDDRWKMDTKMVQQWELFGDPSLKIGGYP